MTETAYDAYRRLYLAAIKRLVDIETLLEMHAEVAADNKKNWGFAGDLNELNDILESAIQCIDPDAD